LIIKCPKWHESLLWYVDSSLDKFRSKGFLMPLWYNGKHVLLQCSRSLVLSPGRLNEKLYKISICCFSAKHTLWRTGWLGILIMCPLSGVTCLHVDCCFSEIGLWKFDLACWSKQTSILSKSNLFQILHGWKSIHLALSNNHSPYCL